MDVQHAEVTRTAVPKAVHDSDRRGDVGAGTGLDDLAADDELGLAFEHVEGVDVVGVAVRRNALEVGTEGELDHLELRELGEDPMEAGSPGNLFAAVRAGDDAALACRASSKHRRRLSPARLGMSKKVPYEHLFV